MISLPLLDFTPIKTNPTGLLALPPLGPAIPLVAIAKSADEISKAPSSIF